MALPLVFVLQVHWYFTVQAWNCLALVPRLYSPSWLVFCLYDWQMNSRLPHRHYRFLHIFGSTRLRLSMLATLVYFAGITASVVNKESGPSMLQAEYHCLYRRILTV
ncbi:hypothetical protein OK016_11235 [Vibrio chagasii]|nr:hypothetical protein [Vibrio chagasii]